MARNLVLHLDFDPDVECPNNFNDWQIVSFHSRHTNYQHEEIYLPPSIGLRRKLKVGTAFWIEYNNSLWNILYHGDSDYAEGILLWQQPSENLGPKTYDERFRDARNYIDTYNNWATGNVFGFQLKDETGEIIESCWGFYEPEYMLDQIREQLEIEDKIVKVTGDASFLTDAEAFNVNPRNDPNWLARHIS